MKAVSCQPLNAKAWVCAWVSPRGICGGQSDSGTGFSLRSSVFPSVLFHCGSPYWYIIRGMNKRSTGGCSSETQSHPIDINMVNNIWWRKQHCIISHYAVFPTTVTFFLLGPNIYLSTPFSSTNKIGIYTIGKNVGHILQHVVFPGDL
jgi:hypothetical protein